MNSTGLIAALVLVVSAASPMLSAYGAGTETTVPSPAASLDYAAGKAAVEGQDWATAIRRLSAAVRADPANADAENLLGFAYRKSGDYDEARKHYGRALKLDPDHRGAREYLGEAFLELKDLPKAEEQLAELVRLCPSGCEERRDLEQAIDAYRKANPGG